MPFILKVTFVDDRGTPLPNTAVRWRLTWRDGTEIFPWTDGNTSDNPAGLLTIPNIPDPPTAVPVPVVVAPVGATGRRGPALLAPRVIPEVLLSWKIDAVEKTGIAVQLPRAETASKQTYRPGDAVTAPDFSNPDRDWLTYESLFNKDLFRKPCCEFKLGLYLIPINDLTIWLRDDLDASDLQTFVNSFFPDFESEQIKKLANSFWWWKEAYEDFWIAYQESEEIDLPSGAKRTVSSGFEFTPKKAAGNRDEIICYEIPYAVLPYNRFDNIETSRALATKNPNNNILRVKDADPYLWSAWKTASRSCVARLPAQRTKEKGILWKTNSPDSIARAYEPWAYDVSHRGGGYKTFKNNPYKLKDRVLHRDFSLKTGVEYVGDDFQGGSNHKDIIGDWLIGCLRSDLITKINRDLKPPKDGIIVLTELITITEKTTRSLATIDGPMDYKEGIQIRDISVLNKDRLYLAPLNIPFVSLDLKEFKTEYHYLDEKREKSADNRKKWREFWKKAFASALGRAKALFLLRYGLQILNPNQQNFLIEFEDHGGNLEPTGTVAFRDLNDASIVREVVWAYFDGPGLPPQAEEGWKELGKLSPRPLKFEFEDGRMKKEGYGNQEMQETGTTNKKFGLPGIQFLWQRFSSFGNITKPPKGVGDDVALLRNLLETMADWGMAHDKSFIACVENHFGVNFRDIDWSRYPKADRFKNITDMKSAEEQTKPKVWRATNGPTLHINDFRFAKLSGDQKLALNAKINACTEATQAYFNEDECLLINGTGFATRVSMTVGTGTVNPEFIIGNDTLVVVSPQAAQINAVQRKESGFAIKNEGGSNETAHYDYVSDVNYINEMDWEERYAKVIHDYLAGADGQSALKKLKGGWALATPKFAIKFTGADGKPFAWKRIFMKEAAKEWTDLTDGDGKIHIYDGDAVGIKICPQKDEDTAKGAVWLECKNDVWEGITIAKM
jgi:hypothetical protein